MELSERAVRANKLGATFKVETIDGEEKVTGGFFTFDQFASFYQDGEGKGGRERALKYASNTARAQENHETPVTHPLSKQAKSFMVPIEGLGSSMYHNITKDTTDDVVYTKQKGTPQKGKAGEAGYAEASKDFAPAKYKGLDKVIDFLEEQIEKAKVAA